jgi:hypothetical protein
MATETCTRDPIDYHAVMIALSKARAMASVLEQLGEDKGPGYISNNLVHALRDGQPGRYPDETIDWLHDVVARALRAALDDAEAAFRKSLTPEQARAQAFGVTEGGDD